MKNQNEIIVYEPDDVIRLDVVIKDETVWLTQSQLSCLFERDRSVITKHINNIFKEKELDAGSNVHFMHIANSDKPVKIYSLDVIISVGYRIKSNKGTQFRIWANKVLKEYLLKGYVMNNRFLGCESFLERKLAEHDKRISVNENKIDFFVRTALPPIEGVFCEGQIFDSYVFASNLIKMAKHRIILIDNYIDESVLKLLSKRTADVDASIYSKSFDKMLLHDMGIYRKQYDDIKLVSVVNVHDRFLLIDNDVYHIGASLKDLGKKLFAFSKMKISAVELLRIIQKPR
ncbi:MAG: virulence RhuM family protein [Bacteroidales bacterium]|nr:virulence RhuM family protein [Bacteroidales bacterium]